MGTHPPSSSASEYTTGLIHIDTIGPLRIPGRRGERFVLGITDDSTRYATTYSIKNKSTSTQLIIDYCRERQAQSRPVSHIRVDNAGELVSDTLVSILRSSGLRVSPIPPFSQFLNGVAERFNGTLMGIVRALLSDSEVPLHFWPDAVAHATRL
jgi:transposase InsO family protein